MDGTKETDARGPRVTLLRPIRPRLARSTASSYSSPLSQFSSTRGAARPIRVLRRKSSTAGLHLSSASRSPTCRFCFALLVASLTLAHSLACWSVHLEQYLN